MFDRSFESPAVDKEHFIIICESIKNSLQECLDAIIRVENHFQENKLISEYFIPFFDKLVKSITARVDKKSTHYYAYINHIIIDQLEFYLNEIIEKIDLFSNSDFKKEAKQSLSVLDNIFWLKQPSRHIRHPLPSTLHRIWFGSFLTDRYQKYLLNFKKNHLHFKIFIWTDFETLKSGDITSFREFCSEHHIFLKNIREYTGLENHDLIIYELDDSVNDSINPLVHYARASDLARVAILLEQGGLYTDMDTDCCESLPELDLLCGFLITKAQIGNPVVNGRLIKEKLGYDFIASLPNNKVLKVAVIVSRLDYRVYLSSQNKTWRMSILPRIQMTGTIALTGSAIFCALDYLIAAKQIKQAELNSLFFVPDEYMTSFYDKSWLDETNERITKILESTVSQRQSDQISLESFIAEINDARDMEFPLGDVKSNFFQASKIGFFNGNDQTLDEAEHALKFEFTN